MRTLIRNIWMVMLPAFAGPALGQGDCFLEFQYPGEAIEPDALGDVTVISTCNYLSEHAVITGIAAGSFYEFTIEGQAPYITVRQGSPNGPVIAQGQSPVSAQAVNSGDLFAHWSLNANCDEQVGVCLISTVQLLLGCAGPSGYISIVDDCEAGTFVLSIVLTGTGSGSTADVAYTIDGVPGNLAGVGIGTYALPSLPFGTPVTIVLEHESEATCDNLLGTFTGGSDCPIIGCGPDSYSVCYGNGYIEDWTFVSSSGLPVAIQFQQGNLGFCCDELIVYDGPTNLDPILFQGSNDGEDLDGLTFVSTNAQDALTMELFTDGFGSCEDGSTLAMEWSVGCLDCVPPQVDVNVFTDCDQQAYAVAVIVQDLGSAASLDLLNTQGAPTVVATSPGNYFLGPFQVGQPVDITVDAGPNPLCDLVFEGLTNSFCPIVSCGPDNYTWCYDDVVDSVFTYISDGALPIAIIFNSGGIESCCDFITIHDGLDDSAPIIYTGNNNGNLAGLQFQSNNPDNALTFILSSDGSISCAAGDFAQELDWTVTCVDCTAPNASIQVITDCDQQEYSVEVTIADLGSATSATITNDQTSQEIQVTAPGTFVVGPFSLNQLVEVGVITGTNPICNLLYAGLQNTFCPILSCGPDNYSWCYSEDEDSLFTYVSTSASPVVLTFNSGGIESCCDYITVYDGVDQTAPVIYFGNNDGDLAGLQFASSNPYYALTFLFTSDGSVSCASGYFTEELDWTVSCLDCTSPQAELVVVPDCEQQQFSVVLDITAGSAPTVDVLNLVDSTLLTSLVQGTYTVGPFALGTSVAFQLVDTENNLCTFYSDTVSYLSAQCITLSCGLDQYSTCYLNSDTLTYQYAADTDEDIALTFTAGQLLVGDLIRVYDGPTVQWPLLYQGNNGGNLSGLSLGSSNTQYALTLQAIGNASGSCDDGLAVVPLQWFVVCGSVGIQEAARANVAVFPNPTVGLITLAFTDVGAATVMVDVLDLSGRVALSFGGCSLINGQTELDLSPLANGSYVVRASTNAWSTKTTVQVLRQ
jgi:Secretion system C-terminal sorting domain